MASVDAPSGPLARLFGSLANVLLDVGLPAMRAWLRERLGPDADVAQVTTDGALIHCDGVRLPVGPRGVIALERATVVVTTGRGLGLPEMRLHAFRGVVAFGEGANAFVAEVAFASARDPEEAAWIAGELTIRRATWPLRGGGPVRPMHGRARLVVTSTDFRLEGGELAGVEARVRFAGEGSTAGGVAAADAVRAASLALENAFVGPFVDAVQVVLGRAIDVPPGVPLDARLTGDIAWETHSGGTCILHIAAEGLRLDIDAKASRDGADLLARVTGEVAPAAAMARAGIAAALRPREEDRVAIAIEASGAAKNPVVRGTLSTPELGFRFGRARFQPALVATEVAVDVDLTAPSDTVKRVVRAKCVAKLGGAPLAIDADLPTADPAARRIVVRASGMEGAWIAAIAGAAGVPVRLHGGGDAGPAASFFVPRDARMTGAATIAWAGGGLGVTAAADVTTPRTRLVVDPVAFVAGGAVKARIAGELAVADALAVGLFPSDVRPVAEGIVRADVVVEGPSSALVLHGRLAADALAIEIASRRDVPPYHVTGVDGAIAVTRERFCYEDVRFAAWGGALRAEGAVPFAGASGDAPRLVLTVDGVDATCVEALAKLAGGRVRLCVEREGERADGEVWLPRGARLSGELCVLAGPSLAADATLETPDGTLLVGSFALSGERRVDGSAVRGSVAIADALLAGGVGASGAIVPVAEGIAQIDVQLDGAADAVTVAGFATLDRLALDVRTSANAPTFVLTELATLFRADAQRFVWHRLESRAYGGSVASAGLLAWGPLSSTVQSTVALGDVVAEELPIDRAGARLGEIVCGRLSVEMRLDHRGADGETRGRGAARLEHGAFPALRHARAPLARYGLAPPPAGATAPATAAIELDARGLALRDVTLEVRGCAATGSVRLGRDGALDGALVVTIADELLRSSALLVVPAVLTERLVLPVRLRGTTTAPAIDADLGACFGRFVVENRVSHFVTGVASDVASLLTGRAPPNAPESREPSGDDAAAVEDDALARELVAHAAEWNALEQRLERHKRSAIRVRVGV